MPPPPPAPRDAAVRRPSEVVASAAPSPVVSPSAPRLPSVAPPSAHAAARAAAAPPAPHLPTAPSAAAASASATASTAPAALPPPPLPAPCAQCGQPALFMCSQCGPRTRYCSGPCQTADWAAHRRVCVGASAARRARESQSTLAASAAAVAAAPAPAQTAALPHVPRRDARPQPIPMPAAADIATAARAAAAAVPAADSSSRPVWPPASGAPPAAPPPAPPPAVSRPRLPSSAAHAVPSDTPAKVFGTSRASIAQRINYKRSRALSATASSSASSTPNTSGTALLADAAPTLARPCYSGSAVALAASRSSDDCLSQPLQQPRTSPSSDRGVALASPTRGAPQGDSESGDGDDETRLGDEDDDDEADQTEDLRFYINQIYLIIKPVAMCIALSILWVKLTQSSSTYYGASASVVASITRGSTSDSNAGIDFLASFQGAAIILSYIIGSTIIMVLLFRYNHIKILWSFFVVMVLLLLGLFGYYLGSDLLVALGWAFDYISFVFLLWNLCCVGIAVIFYRGPLWLQQVYLVVMSSMMAFSLTALADLTTWILLGFLALWDLVAVLCPFGPLRILLETSREQNREIPALLYTAMATPGRPPSERRRSPHDDNRADPAPDASDPPPAWSSSPRPPMGLPPAPGSRSAAPYRDGDDGAHDPAPAYQPMASVAYRPAPAFPRHVTPAPGTPAPVSTTVSTTATAGKPSKAAAATVAVSHSVGDATAAASAFLASDCRVPASAAEAADRRLLGVASPLSSEQYAMTPLKGGAGLSSTTASTFAARPVATMATAASTTTTTFVTPYDDGSTPLASQSDPDSTVDGETDGVAADEDDGEAGESDADDDAEADERNNLKLGLGDFVFYSVLIARAAVFDWVTTIACVVVVMMGLNITIFLLVIYRKALPALPISIAFGILFYFASSKTLAPMVNGLVYLPDGRPALTNASIFVGRFGGAGAVYI